MKKISKRLALTTQTIRVLQGSDLSQVQGGTGTLSGGTSIIRPQNPGATFMSPSGGTSIISVGGGGGH